MEEKKDNFWLYVGGIIAAAVILVFLLKGREMESLHPDAYEQLKQETIKQMQNN